MAEYTCDCCGETFTKMWTDDEAMKNFKKDYPEHVDEKLAVVCADCYKAIFKWYLAEIGQA